MPEKLRCAHAPREPQLFHQRRREVIDPCSFHQMFVHMPDARDSSTLRVVLPISCIKLQVGDLRVGLVDICFKVAGVRLR